MIYGKGNEAYNKLAQYLPEHDKGRLDGISDVREELDNFILNLCDDFNDESILGKIKEEVAKEVIDELKSWLDNMYDEYLIAFVDNNNYCIDENGEVVKEEKE